MPFRLHGARWALCERKEQSIIKPFSRVIFSLFEQGENHGAWRLRGAKRTLGGRGRGNGKEGALCEGKEQSIIKPFSRVFYGLFARDENHAWRARGAKRTLGGRGRENGKEGALCEGKEQSIIKPFSRVIFGLFAQGEKYGACSGAREEGLCGCGRIKNGRVAAYVFRFQMQNGRRS